MSDWYSYHQILLVRLLSLVIIFAVIWPALWLLLSLALRLFRRAVQSLGLHAPPRQGHPQ